MAVRRRSRWIVVLIAAALATSAAGAESRSRASKAPKPLARVGPRFSTRDRETITKYFQNPYSAIPSIMKNGGPDVPPGLRRQVEISSVLPRELERRMLPFPPPLEARLSRLGKPYQRAVIGPDVIILNRKTQQVSDLMRSVLIPAHTGFN